MSASPVLRDYSFVWNSAQVSVEWTFAVAAAAAAAVALDGDIVTAFLVAADVVVAAHVNVVSAKFYLLFWMV